LERLPCLHRDDAIDAGAANFSFQLGREEIASNDAHLIINPPVLRCGVFPEVLMGINFHSFAGTSFT
jgi:hypothetical protein